jgi:hypothetical protein
MQRWTGPRGSLQSGHSCSSFLVATHSRMPYSLLHQTPRSLNRLSYIPSRSLNRVSGLTAPERRGVGVRRVTTSSRAFTLSRAGPSFSPRRQPHISQQSSLHIAPDTMVAQKIDGTAIAKSIRERLHQEIEAKQKANPRYKPCLKIIQGTIYITKLPSMHKLTGFTISWRPLRFLDVCAHEAQGCPRS